MVKHFQFVFSMWTSYMWFHSLQGTTKTQIKKRVLHSILIIVQAVNVLLEFIFYKTEYLHEIWTLEYVYGERNKPMNQSNALGLYSTVCRNMRNALVNVFKANCWTTCTEQFYFLPPAAFIHLPSFSISPPSFSASAWAKCQLFPGVCQPLLRVC